MFLQDDPLGPGDRVLAGLSVAFDASCEEMWLAWRHGACLVPAPRSLVRSGMDLGPWLVTRGITVVSTVPTLAALWPAEALDAVRLLIFGGEACPPELAERLAVDGREVWNTYGPTEATVVACAARLTGGGPVRHRAAAGRLGSRRRRHATARRSAMGEIGELVIGGVGLARYLDPAKDAEKYAPMPTLGWERAYRSGDLVRLEREGLCFCGRADDQVKLGGRRIELGEVDAALQTCPGSRRGGRGAADRRPAHQLLVGYLVGRRTGVRPGRGRARGCAEHLPAALVPRLAVVDELPTRTSGKVDRDALPWPLAGRRERTPETAELRHRGVAGRSCGGTCSAPRSPAPTPTSSTLGGGAWPPRSSSPRCAALSRSHRRRPLRPSAARLRSPDSSTSWGRHRAPPTEVRPTPRLAPVIQTAAAVPLATLAALQWVTWLALGNNVAHALRLVPWPWW